MLHFVEEHEMRRALDSHKLKAKVLADYYERADAETLLSRYHSLGARKAIGHRLCYSVSYQGE